MFLGGKKWIPRGLNQTQQTKRQPINQSVAELMKPLGEKTWQGNVWGSAIMNVQKGEPTPPVETFILLAENNDFLETEGGNNIEFEH